MALCHTHLRMLNIKGENKAVLLQIYMDLTTLDFC